jgi:hypothetical protein
LSLGNCDGDLLHELLLRVVPRPASLERRDLPSSRHKHLVGGSLLEIPFRVALNLSLDWSQNDQVASN